MRFEDVVFLVPEDADEAHADALSMHGGASGIRDSGLVESASLAPQNSYYSTLAEFAAAYVFGVARNHGYVDGNKRTAAITATLPRETERYCELVVALWNERLDRDSPTFNAWLRRMKFPTPPIRR